MLLTMQFMVQTKRSITAGYSSHGVRMESVELFAHPSCGCKNTYGEVAKAIGQPTAHRAVARACAAKSCGGCNSVSSRGDRRWRCWWLSVGF